MRPKGPGNSCERNEEHVNCQLETPPVSVTRGAENTSKQIVFQPCEWLEAASAITDRDSRHVANGKEKQSAMFIVECVVAIASHCERICGEVLLIRRQNKSRCGRFSPAVDFKSRVSKAVQVAVGHPKQPAPRNTFLRNPNAVPLRKCFSRAPAWFLLSWTERNRRMSAGSGSGE